MELKKELWEKTMLLAGLQIADIIFTIYAIECWGAVEINPLFAEFINGKKYFFPLLIKAEYVAALFLVYLFFTRCFPLKRKDVRKTLKAYSWLLSFLILFYSAVLMWNVFSFIEIAFAK